MAFSFNGSTLTYNGAVAEIRSMTVDHQAAEIDVTNAADTVMIFETGTDNVTVTIELNGDTTIDVGSAGAILTVTWNSGDTEVLTLGTCTQKTTTGSVDTGIVTTLVFKNTQ